VTETNRLYDLLPAVHRARDADAGGPLLALLGIVAEQVDVVEADIARLYDNWFIETCEDWVVPYIGDLIGYRPVPDAGPAVIAPRREVAGTIGYRRRKGTLALLERLAADVGGWPAHAVEMFRLLAYAQASNHLRPGRGGTVDLRDGDALDRLDGPQDELAHTVDVRRIASHRTQGRLNVPSVAVFAWRLLSTSITRAPAYCQQGIAAHFFSFSALANDEPLFTPQAPLPVPLRRRALERHPERYVGEDRAFAIWIGTPPELVPVGHIVAADLGDWKYRPARDQVAVDPERGRIAFHPRQPPERVWVTYHHGFSAHLGGGEYVRPVRQAHGATIYRVGADEELKRIGDALARRDEDDPADAVIEITDSGVYTEPLAIALAADRSLQIRGAVGRRPVIRLLDWQTDQPDSLRVTGEPGSRFVLDGLLVTGQAIAVQGDLTELAIRHCTLVPGWGLNHACEPRRPGEPSLILYNTRPCVAIEHSIVGSIQINEDAVGTDPVSIAISDSIADATSRERMAIGGPPDLPCGHAVLDIRRATVFGDVHVHAIDLTENSIFEGAIRVARRQRGCMRFCSFVDGPDVRTPRRFECLAQPRPEFTSVRYGTPAYCQLAQTCPDAIVRGADDESELGVFHDLFQPQRLANLRGRLDEYSPAGMQAGVIFAT
jgi:hypothetical protein